MNLSYAQVQQTQQAPHDDDPNCRCCLICGHDLHKTPLVRRLYGTTLEVCNACGIRENRRKTKSGGLSHEASIGAISLMGYVRKQPGGITKKKSHEKLTQKKLAQEKSHKKKSHKKKSHEELTHANGGGTWFPNCDWSYAKNPYLRYGL